MASSSNISYFEFPQLKTDNFDNWLFRVESILDERQLKDVLERDIDAQDITKEEKPNLVKKDARAKAVIVQCVNDKHLNIIKDGKTAKEMVQRLKNIFQRKSVLSKLHLRRKLLTIKMADNEKLEDYFHRFETIIRELECMDTKIDKTDKVCYLLIGLHNKYDTVITAIETIKEDCSLDFVKTRLLDEELKLYQNNQNSENKNEMAFKSITCYRCNKEGHMAYECRAQTNNRGRSVNRSRRGRGRSRVPMRDGNQSRSKAHYSEADEVTFTALNAYMESDLKSFILDSGATNHLMRSDLEPYMTKVTTLARPAKIIAANNKEMIAYKKGELAAYLNKTKITIEALLVEEMRCNLLSISKLVDNKFKVMIDQSGLTLRKDQYIFKAPQVNRLYILKLEIIENCENKVFSAEIWHQRLGHINRKGMKILGLPYSNEKCETCIEGKATRIPFNENKKRSARIGELIHTDVCGPVKADQITLEGYKYFQVIIDDYSHFTVVYLLKTKGEAEENVMRYIQELRASFNTKTARIRLDNGGEFSSNNLKSFCRHKGIKMEYTMAYTPQQNGKAERMNRTLLDKVRTKFIDTNLPKSLWGEALRASTYELNRSPTKCLNGKAPAEIWYGQNNLTKLKIFGCKAWAVNLKRENKLEPKARPYVFVGYSKGGYRLWSPEENKIIESRDVIFDETKYKYLEERNNQQDRQQYVEQIQKEIGETDKNKVVNENEAEHMDENTKEEENLIEQMQEKETETSEVKKKEEYSRSGRQVKTPQYLEEYETYYAYCMLTQTEEPTLFEEAVMDEEWKEAMEKELTALRELKTWQEVERPINTRIIDTKWIYKVKEDGTKKARLVAKGFQVKNNDPFNIMYAPVARNATVRMMMSKAVQEQLPIRQLDIPTAFLNGELKSEIFIKVPQGLKIKDKNNVLKLNKALYGLIESPKCWNETIDKFAKENGYKRSEYDYCLYYKEDSWMIIYVDDLILIGEIEGTVNSLIKEFRAKDLGQMKTFLGMEIERNTEGLIIRQEKLIDKILKKFNMTECKGIETPMEANLQLIDSEERRENDFPYRELIGSLMYLTVTSRPDLTYSVSYLSRFLDKPSEQIWKAGKRVLRYLKQTKNKGLIFKRSTDTKLYAYSDADWAGDKTDRKSVSGCIIFYGENPVAWFSKKQRCVSLSTAESEYIAAATTAQELINLKGIRKHLGYVNESILLVDNKGAISMAKSYENSKRTKHIDIRAHYIKDLIDKNLISIEYINSENNYADLMTKSLCKPKLIFFTESLLN